MIQYQYVRNKIVKYFLYCTILLIKSQVKMKGEFDIMNINIETDIDANIQKLDELLEKLELVEDKSKMVQFLTIKEFCKLRNCSLSTGQKLFRLSSFPSENYREGGCYRS